MAENDGNDRNDWDDAAEAGRPGGNRADIEGDANGPVVVGSHNLVIDADHGSTVTVLMAGRRPRPERRRTVALLPRRQRAPLGREAELAVLAAAVAAGETVQLWGEPGVGKSALLRYAARALPPGEHGVLFLDAARREPEDLAQDMFEACYETSGYAPATSDLCRLMTGLKVTVYVDNADYAPAQLRALMDTAPDATFVLASREGSLLGDDGTARRLTGVDLDAAMELLGRELGRHVVEADEQDVAAALWEAAAGRPLPLLRAAALARLDPAATLPRPGAVAELLPPLLARLDAPARRALHLLGILGGAEVDPAHLGLLDGAEDPGALYASLAVLGLAEETERGYRVVTDVVPALREHGGPAPFSVEQLCHHFARWAGQATTSPAQVAAHTGALERVAELADRAGRPDLAVRVARAASPALARSLRFGVWGRLLDRGLPAARRAEDRWAEAYFTHEQGVRAALTGNRVAAGVLLAGAVKLWHDLGDSQGAEAASAAQQYLPQQPPPDAGTAATPSGPSSPDPVPAQSPADPPLADPTNSQATGPSGGDGSAGQGASPPGGDGSAGQAMNPPGPDPSAASTAHAPGADPGPSFAHPANPPAGTDPYSVSGPTTTTPGTPPPDLSAATAATAATAPVSTGAAAAVLKVLAAVAAVVIGGVAVDQYQDAQHTSSSTTAPSASYSAPYTPPDTSIYDEEKPTPTPEPTGLAGVWQLSDGRMVQFTESGSDSYTSPWQDNCGETHTTEYTGGGGTYSAEELAYDVDDKCGTPIGEVLKTITLSSDPDTAYLSVALPSDADPALECLTCGSFTLTRMS
ncbi:ATP-binding protein [Streptomyces sp. NPDC023723]|uniref:ATP-binding protein n=1 Tax=Streptomyces sp. NPDC023723 TaxID=3154323 RepID=UPI0033C462D0